MISNIVEVLAKIAEGLSKNNSPNEILSLISKEKKYNKNIVSAAYSWIHDKMMRDMLNYDLENSGMFSIRYLSKEEKEVISEKNYNYLLYFFYIGLLTTADMENIIEQLMLLSETSITFDTINLLILSMFLNMEEAQLPGSRFLLYSSDTIN